jgi:hypothetical protein
MFFRKFPVAATVVILTGWGVMARDAPADKVTGIQAVHRHGQTFVTWQDAAEGEA